MLKLNILFKKLNKTKVYSYCRLFTTEIQQEPETQSTRQKLWLESQQRYKTYENILYSSYLELQEEHMGYGFKRSLVSKIRKDVKRQRKQEKQWSKGILEIPKDWMEEYEYYTSPNDEGDSKSNKLGSADTSEKPSKVPCNGCGAQLHCNHHTRPGFLPVEIFKGRTDKELKSLTCQRCHFLKNHNIALDLEVTPKSYIETISRIQDEFALAIVIVDILDFPCSLWPGMHDLLGAKRPVFIVGNKVDLLPRDSNSYLEHVKKCLMEEIIRSGFNELNIKNISLVSAKTGYGIEELITQLQKIWAYKGNVYLMGCTNVGKSSLFNILLNSDYCRPEASELIPKATTCPWPGTTLQTIKFPIYRPSDIRVQQRLKRLHSENFGKAEMAKLRIKKAQTSRNISDIVPVGAVGRTFVMPVDGEVVDPFSMSKGTQPITVLNERNKEYQNARWVYDTPGVMHPDQITNLLTPQEVADIQPKQMISPRAYRLKTGMSLLLAGLARLDFVESDSEEVDWIQAFLFASFNLPTLIVKTESAQEIYERYLNTPLLQLPLGDEHRLKTWPGLQCHPNNFYVKGYILQPKINDNNCSADITLSSAGWVGLRVPADVECTFKVWTPDAKGIHLRSTSLVPYAERLIGKRIRNSLAYNISKPFVFKK